MVDFNFSGKTFLIVDDEDELRDLLGAHLQGYGANILEAPSGRVAVGLLKKAKVDLIICDVRMREGDGLFVLEYVRELTPRPKFLFMTGYSDFSAEFARLSGAQEVLQKPFKIKELEEVIFRNIA